MPARPGRGSGPARPLPRRSCSSGWRPRCRARRPKASPFASGTTSGTCGSSRKALELSTISGTARPGPSTICREVAPSVARNRTSSSAAASVSSGPYRHRSVAVGDESPPRSRRRAASRPAGRHRPGWRGRRRRPRRGRRPRRPPASRSRRPSAERRGSAARRPAGAPGRRRWRRRSPGPRRPGRPGGRWLLRSCTSSRHSMPDTPAIGSPGRSSIGPTLTPRSSASATRRWVSPGWTRMPTIPRVATSCSGTPAAPGDRGQDGDLLRRVAAGDVERRIRFGIPGRAAPRPAPRRRLGPRPWRPG